MKNCAHEIPKLPLEDEIESKRILKMLISVRAALGTLNGIAESIPNERIIINTLALQEAKDSSAIENIVTTNDELYMSDNNSNHFTSIAAKEVFNYSLALQNGYAQVKKNGLLTTNNILTIQGILEENNAGIRKLPGTSLKNEQTGEIVYTPPQTEEHILELLKNLEEFINNSGLSTLDPVIKMAIIHHQFETIHPFYDGNGRTGRIINILYLVKENLLTLPILYLSRYINQNKAKYYKLLQDTRNTGNWEPWILYMLQAVEQTALQTSDIVKGIKKLMAAHKSKMRTELPKLYSQDLLNNIFRHPYTKIEYVKNDLGVAPKTASGYLDQLCDIGIIRKRKIGKENYYFNDDLINLLADVGKLSVVRASVPAIVTSTSGKEDSDDL